MIYRPAKEHDINKIMEIYGQKVKHDNVEYTKNDILWYINNKSNGKIVVAEHNNNVVGFILGYNMGRWLYIEYIIVDINFRLKSIGTHLIKQFIKANKNPSIRVIECAAFNNKGVIAFIKNVGFKFGHVKTRWYYKDI